MHKIILASKSPRRQELLKVIIDDFEIKASHVDESFDPNMNSNEIAMYLSRIKAEEIYKDNKEYLVIGADTIVVCNEEILNKPGDDQDAYRMLKKLSGKTHQVITGVTLISKNHNESFYSSTDVTFYDLLDNEIFDYISTQEPFDKAGGYGIQGKASKFIKEIKGDYYTVMGLPVSLLYQKLKEIERK